jgi:two-component system, chemotaxis family, sensor kinase CheA
MGEMMNEGQNLGDNFDLSQFYQIFFEEAGENLDQMEQMLLQLDLEQADDEELNAIFRCAHSIKGGAATFGFADVAELTHQMESLLDKLRRHELQPTSDMVDVLLESSDALRLLLARHQGKSVEPPATAALVTRISTLAEGGPLSTQSVAPAPTAAPPASAPAPVASTPAPRAQKAGRSLEIHIGPLDHPAQADGIAELFRDIPGLGELQVLPCDLADKRIFGVQTTSGDTDLLDLFTFHVSKEIIHIVDLSAAEETPVVAAPPAKPRAVEGQDFGFFDDAPGMPGATAETAAPAQAPVVEVAQPPAPAPVPAAAAAPRAEQRPANQAQLESSTLRVSSSARPPAPRPPPSACRSRRSTSSSTWWASSSSPRPCWPRRAASSTAPPTSRCWRAWPTWTATPATCRKR